MRYKKTLENAITTTRGSEYAAGFDLYAAEAVSILPHSSKMIDTGIAVEIPNGFFGGVFARSGWACKRGLRPANCVGVIDPDYRDSIKVCLFNDSELEQDIQAGDRIAQMVTMPFFPFPFNEEVDELEDTERGLGGFGSTGK